MNISTRDMTECWVINSENPQNKYLPFETSALKKKKDTIKNKSETSTEKLGFDSQALNLKNEFLLRFNAKAALQVGKLKSWTRLIAK